jgi:hypothetical protein
MMEWSQLLQAVLMVAAVDGSYDLRWKNIVGEKVLGAAPHMIAADTAQSFGTV